MKYQRPLLITVFVLLILSISGWLIYDGVNKWRTTFVAGAPPINLENAIPPQTVDLGKMRPPALRFNDPVLFGGVTSSASVILFGDYRCDDCRRLEQAVKQVLPKYKGAVRYIWRDLPQSDRKYDFDAAVFAYCAGLQGKFWETHNALMLMGSNIDDITSSGLTQSLKLDVNTLNSCRLDQQTTAIIQQDAEQAGGDGVTSTPIMFIGTEAVKGYLPAETIDKKIQLYLGS